MSSGSIHFYYGAHLAPDLAELEERFARIPLRLENPGTQEVTAISAEGDQVPATRAGIAEQLAAGCTVSLQWWINDSEDVYCRLRPDGPDARWVVELGLDGVDNDVAERLIAEMVALFEERRARGEAAALIADRSGALEDVDMDAIVTTDALILKV